MKINEFDYCLSFYILFSQLCNYRYEAPTSIRQHLAISMNGRRSWFIDPTDQRIYIYIHEPRDIIEHVVQWSIVIKGWYVGFSPRVFSTHSHILTKWMSQTSQSQSASQEQSEPLRASQPGCRQSLVWNCR